MKPLLTAGAVLLLGVALVWLWSRGREPQAVRERHASPPAGAAAAAELVAAAPVARESLAPSAPLLPRPDEPLLASTRFVDVSGNPIPGAQLTWAERPERSARSGSDGHALLALDRAERIPPGPTRFEARCAGFATAERRATIDPERTLLLGDWTLVAGGSVAGRVLDEDERGVAGATVACLRDDEDAADFARAARGSADELARPGARATSAADGAFELRDVPAGRIRLVALAEDRPAGLSEPLDVPAGGVALDVVVRMEAADGGSSIRGLVLDPDGRPVAGAEITVRSAGTLDTFAAGHDGRFRARCSDRAPRDVHALDPEQRYREATRLGVEPGGEELVLRLARAPGIPLTVRARAGAPLARFAVGVIAVDDARVLAFAAEEERPGGVFLLAAPAQDFAVEVRANGWLPARLGPFSPGVLPEALECRLDPAGGIHGVVTAEGAPVAGAVVALHEAAVTRITYNGFPLRMHAEPVRERETDSSGAFELSVENAGRYYLRVEHDGWASAEVGPLALAPDVRTEQSIALDPGGTLVVSVRTRGDASVAGTLVALSRGDGRARTERTDAEGVVTFARLTAGDWQVELADAEIDPRYGVTYESTQPAGAVPANCRVVAGEVTRVELWLEDRGRRACAVAGRLLLDGAPAAGFTAQLEREGEVLGKPRPLDATGAFRVDIDEPGSYRLRLVRMDPGAGYLLVRDPVELVEGEQSWSLDLATATIVGKVDAVRPDALYVYRWRRGALTCEVPLALDAEGRFRSVVPAGSGALVRAESGRLIEEQTPVVLREVEAAAGETATVDP